MFNKGLFRAKSMRKNVGVFIMIFIDINNLKIIIKYTMLFISSSI